MAYYPSLRDYKTKAERVRIIENIQRLKTSIAKRNLYRCGSKNGDAVFWKGYLHKKGLVLPA